MEYTILLEPADEGGYVVHVPALPGCHSEGDTLEEALAMARDAIECYLGSLDIDGIPYPPDKPFNVVRLPVTHHALSA